jgi:uncharacterized membrane protein
MSAAEARRAGAAEARGGGAARAGGPGAARAGGTSAARTGGADRVLRWAAVAVALVGLGIATYLTVVHYAGADPVCAVAHGCATVQKSRYAELGGMPVALLGLIGYLAILASLVRDDEVARTVTAFLAIVGLAFSGWLTYVEVVVLEAICIWCVGSAICMALLAALSVTRLLAAEPVRVR